MMMSNVKEVGGEILAELKKILAKCEAVFGNSHPAFADANGHIRKGIVALQMHPDLKNGETITDPGVASTAPASAVTAADAATPAPDASAPAPAATPSGTDQTPPVVTPVTDNTPAPTTPAA
jgi:hypothetical protein